MTVVVFGLILLTVVFNTIAQLSLKGGMASIGHFDFSWHNVIPITLQVATSPWIIFGLSIYVGSVVVWLLVLSRIPVSMAYPMASLAYVVNAVAAYYIFGENLSLIRIAGILVILVGVFLVAKS